MLLLQIYNRLEWYAGGHKSRILRKTARVTVAKLLTKANIQNRISELQGR